MNHVLLLQPNLIQTGKVWQFSSENITAQAAIHTAHTSNQYHEAVLPEILRFVQMEREPLPIISFFISFRLFSIPEIHHSGYKTCH